MSHKESWGTRVGLVLAVAGNAVGLGNFLRFPAKAVANGGGAFLIPYIVSFLVMGIPLLWMEWAIGRHGGLYGHHSTPGMLDAIGKRRFWKYLGVFGLFTNLCVAAYYCYIESWTLAYTWYSLTGHFDGMSAQQVAAFFSEYTDSAGGGVFNFPKVALVFFGLTLALNIYVLSRGLVKGIEIASKIGMPLLILFGVVLAIRSLTLDAGDQGAQVSALVGLEYLWTPKYDSLLDPKVWLEAAGQIFFTLSVGMGSIHCYAAYVKRKQDIALNAATAGWMNEFVEVILGASIVVPISVAYFGLEWAKAGGNVGFMMGFKTMPTLFSHWGAFAPLAGLAWFGLLFFAGITSSLAMGQPVMAFLQDEYKFTRGRSAMTFGILTLVLALPCILFFSGGAFDEFDNWSGTVSLVIFALSEAILFSWVWGIDKGWEEITRGADMTVPRIFRFVIKWVTPSFLLAVFLGSLLKPEGEWGEAFANLFTKGWPLANDSIIGSLIHKGVADKSWFNAQGEMTPIFVKDMSRLLMVLVFAGFSFLVWKAWRRRALEAR